MSTQQIALSPDEAVAARQPPRARRRTSRWTATLLGTAAGVALAASAAAPASASTTAAQLAATSAKPAVASQLCTVRATGFVKRGDTNVVTATDTSCDSSATSRHTADQSAVALSNVHVGYGCSGLSFTLTCWYFDVPSNGCASSSSWGWDTISQNNVLSSWEAVGTCSHGTLYDLPVYGGANITCYTCYSLGSMDNRATSLKVFR
jgi:hypothetical protein